MDTQGQNGVEHIRMSLLKQSRGIYCHYLKYFKLDYLSHALLKRPMIYVFWCNLLLLSCPDLCSYPLNWTLAFVGSSRNLTWISCVNFSRQACLEVSPGVRSFVVFLVLSTSGHGWKYHENNLFHSIFTWKWNLKNEWSFFSKMEKKMFGSSSVWSLKGEGKEDLFYSEKLVWSPSAIDSTRFTISCSWFLYK